MDEAESIRVAQFVVVAVVGEIETGQILVGVLVWTLIVPFWSDTRRLTFDRWEPSGPMFVQTQVRVQISELGN